MAQNKPEQLNAVQLNNDIHRALVLILEGHGIDGTRRSDLLVALAIILEQVVTNAVLANVSEEELHIAISHMFQDELKNSHEDRVHRANRDISEAHKEIN